MAEYHVACGAFGIYAGTIRKNGLEWQNKSEVTDEALIAAATYITQSTKVNGGEENQPHGYVWPLKDGRFLQLRAYITEGENG